MKYGEVLKKYWWVIAIILVVVLVVGKLVSNASKIVHIVDDLPQHISKHYASVELSQRKYITIHYPAIDQGIDGNPWSFARHHVNTKNRAGISYHIVILRDGKGTIYQTQELTTRSEHVLNNNTACIGVCVCVGTHEEPTPAQLKSLDWVVGYLRRQCPNYLEVAPHSMFRSTGCPGDFLRDYLTKYN